MGVLRIHLFGRLTIQRGQETLDHLPAHKAQEMLCYLMLHKDRCHRRENLISLLWPADATAQSAKHFRHTLWQLRTVFEADVAAIAGELFLSDWEWISINPQINLWLDVAEFESAYARIRNISGSKFEDHTAQLTREALELYRGDLLEGCYQDWCIFERERLRQMYLSLLGKQMTYCETHGYREEAVEYGLCILRCEPAHERTHRRLMRLYYFMGDRTSALRQYKRCAAILRHELDVSPAPRTVALYESISVGRPIKIGDMSADPTEITSQDTASTLYGALVDLEQLQANMRQLQIHLDETIKTVQMAIKI